MKFNVLILVCRLSYIEYLQTIDEIDEKIV